MNSEPRIRRGSRHPNSKLTEKQVGEIKRRSKAGEPAFSIAKDYPVSRQAINNITRGDTWGHIRAANPIPIET